MKVNGGDWSNGRKVGLWPILSRDVEGVRLTSKSDSARIILVETTLARD
jgi:hypothetical protein